MTASVIYACSKEAIADTSGDNNTELLDKITALEDKLKILEDRLALVEESTDEEIETPKPYGYVEEWERERIKMWYDTEEGGRIYERSYDDKGRLSGYKDFFSTSEIRAEYECIYEGKEMIVYCTTPSKPRHKIQKYTYY